MKWLMLVLLVGTLACSHKKNASAPSETKAVESLSTPQFAFEVSEGIAHPESVIYSAKHKAIFVSNVASGNPMETEKVAYISKLSADGKVEKAKWVTGLKAPKGMAVVKNDLFVADVDRIVKIDIKKAKIRQTWDIANAKFLNDVAADDQGNIYVSDMLDNAIYKLGRKGVKIWIKSSKLTHPNGLLVVGNNHILAGLWGADLNPKTFATATPGGIVSIDLKDPKDDFSIEPSVRGNMDGIGLDKEGTLWISDWMNGDVYKMKKNGAGEKVYNFGQGTADLYYSQELGLLLIPQMNTSKLMAIKL